MSACDDAAPMVYRSSAMAGLWATMQAVGQRETTVLVGGESGTGKELVARRLHALSARHGRPFVPVDCTTLRGSMLESQLFGHVKGAFTGAHQSTLGFIRAAHGGTLFLDEIGDLPPEVQAKLLRCIQERVVIPLGAVHGVPVDVRIIVATHCDLEQMVREGGFREDLYFRLNVVQLRVPPLRERMEDVLPLAEHFLQRWAQLYDEPARRLTEPAGAALMAYDWPGNVRELENAIEHACALCGGTSVAVEHLPQRVRDAEVHSITDVGQGVLPLDVAERNLILKALRLANGNRSQAARLLNIRRQRLYRKIETYGLDAIANQYRDAD